MPFDPQKPGESWTDWTKRIAAGGNPNAASGGSSLGGYGQPYIPSGKENYTGAPISQPPANATGGGGLGAGGITTTPPVSATPPDFVNGAPNPGLTTNPGLPTTPTPTQPPTARVAPPVGAQPPTGQFMQPKYNTGGNPPTWQGGTGGSPTDMPSAPPPAGYRYEWIQKGTRRRYFDIAGKEVTDPAQAANYTDEPDYGWGLTPGTTQQGQTFQFGGGTYMFDPTTGKVTEIMAAGLTPAEQLAQQQWNAQFGQDQSNTQWQQGFQNQQLTQQQLEAQRQYELAQQSQGLQGQQFDWTKQYQQGQLGLQGQELQQRQLEADRQYNLGMAGQQLQNQQFDWTKQLQGNQFNQSTLEAQRQYDLQNAAQQYNQTMATAQFDWQKEQAAQQFQQAKMEADRQYQLATNAQKMQWQQALAEAHANPRDWVKYWMMDKAGQSPLGQATGGPQPQGIPSTSPVGPQSPQAPQPQGASIMAGNRGPQKVGTMPATLPQFNQSGGGIPSADVLTPTTMSGPQTPPWLAAMTGGQVGAPINPLQPAQFASAGGWNQMAPSQKAGLEGYLSYQGIPIEDWTQQMQRLWAQKGASQAQFGAAVQR